MMLNLKRNYHIPALQVNPDRAGLYIVSSIENCFYDYEKQFVEFVSTGKIWLNTQSTWFRLTKKIHISIHDSLQNDLTPLLKPVRVGSLLRFIPRDREALTLTGGLAYANFIIRGATIDQENLMYKLDVEFASVVGDMPEDFYEVVVQFDDAMFPQVEG